MSTRPRTKYHHLCYDVDDEQHRPTNRPIINMPCRTSIKTDLDLAIMRQHHILGHHIARYDGTESHRHHLSTPKMAVAKANHTRNLHADCRLHLPNA